MPTVGVDKTLLFEGLGKNYTTEEFDELCFQFGIELDDDTTEEVAGTDERPQLKIDIPANRYDLLCFEGILRALRVFLQLDEPPKYALTQPKELITMHVREETKQIRPLFAGAVLRNIKFTPENYSNFIDLQDKLHQNLARRRTLVSMGTHDLDTIEAPFTYEARAPKDIKFVPLNRTEEYDAEQLMQLYEGDRHLGRYLHIIRDSPVYPIIYDAQRRVMSMPPIINSDHSKITLDTKNVFIDVTALDQTKLDIVTNIIVAMFAAYCAEPFTVEPVRVVYPDGSEVITPKLESRSTQVRVSYVNSCTGLQLDAPTISKLLGRMGHVAKPTGDTDVVAVDVPATRPDILHECDIMEDVAVAYGFDHLPKTFPATNTVAAPLPINKLSDIVRREFAFSGWTEVLPLILCSRDENYAWLNHKDDGRAILLENPKTAEYQIVRTSLIPGILKSVRENKKHSLPMRVFEVSDVAFKDESEKQRMARNERHVGAVYCNRSASFETVHGLLDKLMLVLGVPRIARGQDADFGYYIQESDDSAFLSGRGASIYLRPKDTPQTASSSPLHTIKSIARALPGQDLNIGTLGVLHPAVMSSYEIAFPCSSLEFNLEPLL